MPVQIVKFSDIKFGDRFRKDYGDLEGLMESIKQFGIIQPLAVTEDLTLIAGGRRYCAIELAGITDVPVNIIPAPDELALREIELEENIQRENLSWQEKALLAREIHKLKQEKLGKATNVAGMGWGLADTGELMGRSKSTAAVDLELAEGLLAFPALADVPTRELAIRILTKAKEGQLIKEINRRASEHSPNIYKYAKNNYIIGDAFDGMAKVASEMASVIECDPPWGVGTSPEREAISATDMKTTFGTDMKESDVRKLTSRIAKETFRIASPHSWMVYWFGIVHKGIIESELKEAGWKLDPIPSIWYKPNSPGPKRQDWVLGRAYEPFFICRKGKPKLNNTGQLNVFAIDQYHHSDKIHPAEKPVELYKAILSCFHVEGTVVVSPFLGSGNILRAVYELWARGFGWELDESVKERFLSRVALDAEKRKEQVQCSTIEL